MQKIAMIEDIPELVFRAYSKPEYAGRFVSNGQFRLGKLHLYRDIEDKSRADETEGLGHYKDKDGIHEHFQFGNQIYLISFSTIDVDKDFLREKMGNAVITINSLEKLITDINEYLNANGYATFGGVKGRRIQYNKGGVVSEELDEMDRAILSVTQKPEWFSPECEYRLFVIINEQKCTRPLNDYIEINLGKKLPYAEIAT